MSVKGQNGGMQLVSVAAVGDDLAIGAEGGLPWESIPADKAQYRRRVAGASVVLGRRTYESMLSDLPGQAQIVLSRSPREYDTESTYHAGGVDSALDVAATLDGETVYVLGGANIYALFQPYLDRMILSRIPGSYRGDAYYPDWKSSEWVRVDEQSHGEFVLERWERQSVRNDVC